MKLSTWIHLNNIKPHSLTKLLKISHAHVYGYLYENVVPRRHTMELIYKVTFGAVTPNDFYDLPEEIFEEKATKLGLTKHDQKQNRSKN